MDEEVVNLELDNASYWKSIGLFSFVYLFLWIPCCFFGGLALLYIGIFEVNLELGGKIRCDNLTNLEKVL